LPPWLSWSGSPSPRLPISGRFATLAGDPPTDLRSAGYPELVLASLIIGGALLLAIVAASGWGAVVLPADARIAVHYGSENHQYLVSKRAGLLIWPALGVILYGALGGIIGSSLAAGWVAGVRDVLVPAVLVVVLAFQAGALITARR
jgi:hypothetical protein